MTSKHTPLPWKVSRDGMNVVAESTNALIAEVFDGKPNFDTDKAISRANARYIVQCCNAYPKLVDALKVADTAIMFAASGQSARIDWADVGTTVRDALRAAGEEL